MAPTRKASEGLLARVNFPLYCVDMLTPRHVLVGGGGGSSKTGVANGIEVFEIYHNGKYYVADETLRHETGPNVVMNLAVRSGCNKSLLLVGQESHCQLYHINPKVIDEDKDGNDNNTNSRRFSNSIDHNGIRKRIPSTSGFEEIPRTNGTTRKNNQKIIRFNIKASDSVQTDFLPTEPLQRVIKISLDGKLMVTGGTDGHVRLWSFPQMVQIADIKAHTKEIDDIDFSPDSNCITSVSKDGKCIVWDVKTAKQKSSLVWATPNNTKFLFKRCRYGIIEGDKKNYRLFTISNPLGRVGKQYGVLQSWNCQNGELTKIVHSDDNLSSIAVRDDGRFLAIGTMSEGHVSVYIAFSLQRILHIPNAHSMFVTGLTFLPVTNLEGPSISSNNELAVLSISIDNKICIHSIKNRHTIPVWLSIILIVFVLLLSFITLSYLGV